jgi:glycosyltransferase involved in cell wall biosynthesis
MKVTFAHFGESVASSRLRAIIPQEALGRIGVGKGKDVLVYGKHFVTEAQLKPFKRHIYDVCDDHFDTPDLKDYYLKHCESADALTCNSEAMRDRIKQVTGRDAFVIGEPYESARVWPSIGPKLLWYGHASNFKDLERISPSLKYPLLALSNHPDSAGWSLDMQSRALIDDCIVIIPTGKSLCKSENRMVEAVRNGKYVCAEYLPAYEKFSQFFDLGNIPEHIDRALSNPKDSLDRVEAAQEFIKDRYSPETIAQQWLEVIHAP